jgi:hypothetical protein
LLPIKFFKVFIVVFFHPLPAAGRQTPEGALDVNIATDYQ